MSFDEGDYAPIRQPLMEALAEGPKVCAAQITHLLYRGSTPLSTPLISPEWLSSLYATELSEVERACFRDAVVLTIELALSEDNESTSDLQAATTLARQIGVFAVARAHTEERLFSVLHSLISAGRTIDASPLAYLLAEEAAARPIQEWTDMLTSADEPEIIVGPCTEGVLKHGAFQCLSWIAQRDEISIEATKELLAEFLPRLVLEDRAGVTRFLDRVGGSMFRSLIYTALARYDLWLPGSQEADAEIGAVISGLETYHEVHATFAIFGRSEAPGPAENAVAELSNADAAGLPAFLRDYLVPDDQAADTGESAQVSGLEPGNG